MGGTWSKEKKHLCTKNILHRVKKAFRSANCPHIRFLEELNIRYIINVTPDGNSFLFKWLEGVDMEENVVTPVDGSKWIFRFANGVPLNDANYDLKVNFLECVFKDANGKVIRSSLEKALG